MAEICVIFASEDEKIVEKLVALLRLHWDTWWAEDIHEGDWEQIIRDQINVTKAVVPVFSRYTGNKSIFKDELQVAKDKKRPIFPFFIDHTDPPLGFGRLNRTNAYNWSGDGGHPGYRELIKKIAAGLQTPERLKYLKRPKSLELGKKTLQLPSFVFSLSSYETQMSPEEGISLLQLFDPPAVLISAYDIWKFYNSRMFYKKLEALKDSGCVIFLDSGNYEASRKKDYFGNDNKNGWREKCFRETLRAVCPDIAFAFDKPDPKGEIEKTADRVIAKFRTDMKAADTIPLCPVVHLPKNYKGKVAECAARLISLVVKALDPIMVASPERELGDGLFERARTVLEIRKTLNSLGRYYPLHLLGTGNPLSMITFAAAGADCFDGLEWCRTVADYQDGRLYHFQHFDCFCERYLMRLKPETRIIVKDPEAAYGARVISYNFDVFVYWAEFMQSMINAGQSKGLLQYVPHIGHDLFEELTK